MRKFLIAIVFILFGTMTYAQVEVTFRAHMGVQIFKGMFTPGTDNVVVRGNFQAAAGDPGGDWQGSFFTMTDTDGDSIYTVTATLPSGSVGNEFLFKFVKAPDGWEAGTDRTFTLAASNQTLPVYWFSNDSIYTTVTNVNNTFEFTADVSAIYGSGLGSFDPSTDSLLVMGLDWDGLGTFISGQRKLVEDIFNVGIFRTSIEVRGPLNDSTKWKFKTFPDDRFSNGGWESGSDRWVTYVADGSTVTLPTIVPRIDPVGAPLTQAKSVVFEVNMANAVNRYNGQPINPSNLLFVGMRGGNRYMGSWSDGGNWVVSDTTGQSQSDTSGYMRVLNDAGNNGDLTAGDNIWSTTVNFPAGLTGGAIEYKFAAYYPGADTINGGSSPLDNEGGFGENHKFYLRDDTPARITNVFGQFTTSIRELEGVNPESFSLGQNYPNPFNPSTKINYSIVEEGLVTLKIYNLLGEEIGALVNENQRPGSYQVDFNAYGLTSGVYFYTLQTGNKSETKKMLLMK